MVKPKVYMIAWSWSSNDGRGDCQGSLLDSDGNILGSHYSSSFGWLRNDLRCKVSNPDDYEFVDLIGKEVPDELAAQLHLSKLEVEEDEEG